MSGSHASPFESDAGVLPLLPAFRSPVLLWLGTFLACLAAALISLPQRLNPAGLPAIWLPTGVALAAAVVCGRRVLGSIFLAGLASWFLVVPAEAAGSTAILLASAVTAALALSAQAAVGGWVLRSWVRNGERFDRSVDLLRFHLLIGPVSCLPGTLVLVAGFLVCGWLSWAAALHVALTAFLASVTGALPVAPLLIFLFGRLPASWIRRPSAWGTMVAAGGISYLALAYAAHTSQDQCHLALHNEAAVAAAELRRQVDRHGRVVETLRSFWESSKTVNRGEFRSFVRMPLERSSFEILGWAPEVFAARPGNGAGPVPAPRVSLPVHYAEPASKEAKFLGRDLLAEPLLATSVEQARSSRSLTASAPFAWDGGPACVVLTVWIDRAHAAALPAEPVAGNGPPGSSGVAFGVLNCARLFDVALRDSARGWAGAVRILDVTGPSSPLEFASLPSPESGAALCGEASNGGPRLEIPVADRTWRLVFGPPAHAWRGVSFGRIWTLQLAVIAVTGLIGALAISAGERTVTIENAVRERTSALVKSNQRFQQLSDSIPEAFWIMEVEPWRFRFVSPAWETITGRKSDDLLAHPRAWTDCVHPDDRDAIQSQLVSPPQEGFDLEYRVRRPDGQIRHVWNRAFPLRGANPGGGGFAGLIEDITERLAREAELSVAKDAAAAATQELKHFFDVSLDLLCLAGTDGYFKQVNPAFTGTLGHSEATLLTRPFLEFVHPEDMDNTLAALQCLKGGGSVVSFENRYRSASGEYLWMEWNAVPDEGGSRIYAAARNVTGRKAMEIELRRSNQELEQFAYVASHDLREPLRVVTSFVQLLAKRYRGSLGQDADEYIGYAVNGAERMRMLIDGLLQVSRVQTRGRELVAIDANHALQSALQNLQLMMSETRATVTADPLPQVMADGVQLTQVFQNLIANALRFRHPDRGPAVRVSALRTDGFQQFTVSDNGRGIESQHFDRIFRIFQQLDCDAEREGTGIGLAICQRIIHRHGGAIWVDSRLGEGSAFHFTLPAVVSAASPGAATA